MSVPLRFDQLQPDRQAAIRKNLDIMHSKGAPDEDVESYLRDVEHLAPAGQSGGSAPAQPGVMERAGTAISSTLHHIPDALGAAVKAPVSSLITALSPGVGENRPSAALSKGGNSSGRPIDTTPYDAAHGGVTEGQRTAAGLQTLANVAAPAVAGAVTKGMARLAIPRIISSVAGTSAAGATAGAAYDPEDPAVGALAGAALAPVAHGALKALAIPLKRAGGGVMDLAGKRPVETSGIAEGVAPRAARLNAAKLSEITPPDNVNKPLAPVDMGASASRLARGLKTASPSAEAVISDALNQRADAAVGRVIDHAKELTGIKRGSGYETHEALKATTSSQGDEAYGKVWDAEGDTPVPSSPELDAVLERPAVKKALPVGAELRANLGEAAPSGRPSHIPPDQWGMLQNAARRGGINLPDAGSGFTLKDLHAAKLAMDDAFRSANERGSSSGRNQARGIASARSALLDVMDKHSPDYAAARSQFADNMSLEDASKQGMEHWTRDPDESAAMLKTMTPGEQQVYRDQAFNKWAQQVENGPADVSKNKPLKLARLRQLFPDDASFQTFQDGLKQEAMMHRSANYVLGGSNSADKLSDVAGLAGVTLPDVLSAASGHGLTRFATKAIQALAQKRLNVSTDALNTERAKLLVAGADGDASARTAALEKMGLQPTKLRAMPPGAPPRVLAALSEALRAVSGVGAGSTTAARRR